MITIFGLTSKKRSSCDCAHVGRHFFQIKVRWRHPIFWPKKVNYWIIIYKFWLYFDLSISCVKIWNVEYKTCIRSQTSKLKIVFLLKWNKNQGEKEPTKPEFKRHGRKSTRKRKRNTQCHKNSWSHFDGSAMLYFNTKYCFTLLS